jgi:ATP-dependent Clp protease adaptor protein ClpS
MHPVAGQGPRGGAWLTNPAGEAKVWSVVGTGGGALGRKEDHGRSEGGSRGQEQTLTRARERVESPRPFKVLLHNDDYTTMDFVVKVLETVFHHGTAEATRIMLLVHRTGIGVAGVFTREVAEERVRQVEQLAEAEGFPLLCSLEPE